MSSIQCVLQYVAWGNCSLKILYNTPCYFFLNLFTYTFFIYSNPPSSCASVFFQRLLEHFDVIGPVLPPALSELLKILSWAAQCLWLFYSILDTTCTSGHIINCSCQQIAKSNARRVQSQQLRSACLSWVRWVELVGWLVGGELGANSVLP